MENTRSRLARELHDSVTQTVFSMNLTTQTARMLIDRDMSRVSGQLDRLQELATNAMKEIHLLVSQLQARPEGKEGLTIALQQLFSEKMQRDGLQVDFKVEGDFNFPAPVMAGLFHIIQEALTNVVKHAGTRQVEVRLNGTAQPAFIEIQDHGKGFEIQSATNQRGHLGMTSMAERAKEIGWNLAVDSQPGEGTRVRISAQPQEVRP